MRYAEGDRYRTFEAAILALAPESLTVTPAEPRPFEPLTRAFTARPRGAASAETNTVYTRHHGRQVR